jgi:prephenate dehydrogenase
VDRAPQSEDYETLNFFGARRTVHGFAVMKPTVAIIGVGLIGGSLGQALRRSGRYRVLGIGRRMKSLRAAKRLGALDELSTSLASAADADIVVICSPVDTVVPIFKKILPVLKAGTIVTDAGSVKGAILRAVQRIAKPASIHFVGGHPLAGSHRTGVEAANPRLFQGSTVVLVPGSRAGLKPLKSLWKAAGARSVVMSADDHDRSVALISHLPHVLSHALVLLLAGRRDRAKLVPLLAGSFRDATRVAASDPEQWSQILRSNAPAVRSALRAFRQELAQLEKALPDRRLKRRLRRSQSFRRPLFNGI